MEKELNIIYTCDNDFLDLASISMESIVLNNPRTRITFYLATESDQHEIFNKLIAFYKDNKNVKIKFLNCLKYDKLLAEKKVDKWGSNTYYVYRRLFAYDLLDADYVWYIDTDILCLKEIVNPKLSEGKILASVIDSSHADYNKLAHINEDYYFYNNGTIFVDVKKWKENRCTEKILNYIENMKYRPLMCDQDILSMALQAECEPLNPKYNYYAGYDYYGIHNSFLMYSLDKKPFYTEKEVEEAKKDITFYHCLEGVFGRPWQEGNTSPIKDEFLKYQKTSAYPNLLTRKKDSTLFKIEKALEILPDFIYVRIHNYAQKLYLKRLSHRKA